MKADTQTLANLPIEVQEVVNRMLFGGSSDSGIIEHLTSLGHGGLGVSNLTNWKKGAYREWLQRKETADRLEFLREIASKAIQTEGWAHLPHAGIYLAVAQLYDLLLHFDSKKLKRELGRQPKQYTTLVSTLARISKQALDLEKFKEH